MNDWKNGWKCAWFNRTVEHFGPPKKVVKYYRSTHSYHFAINWPCSSIPAGNGWYLLSASLKVYTKILTFWTILRCFIKKNFYFCSFWFLETKSFSSSCWKNMHPTKTLTWWFRKMPKKWLWDSECDFVHVVLLWNVPRTGARWNKVMQKL